MPDDVAVSGRRFFCSWSGGKDAYLALQRAVAAGGRPVALLCMLHEDGRVSRGHGLPLALLQRQAAALGLPLVARATTWDDYEATYVAALHELREGGVQAGVFGDIDLQPHRDWVEAVCAVAGLACHLPLWQEPRRRLLERAARGRRRRPPSSPSTPPAWTPRSWAAAWTPPSSPTWRPPAPTPAARRASTTPWSPRPRRSPCRCRCTWRGVTTRDGHWVLEYARRSGKQPKGARNVMSLVPFRDAVCPSGRRCWRCWRWRPWRPAARPAAPPHRPAPSSSAGPITVTDDCGTR